MPNENWGKITFQDWTFYIQFWEYPYTGEAKSRQMFFCHFCLPHSSPICHLMKTVSKRDSNDSTGLQSVLDSLVRVRECIWVPEKVHGNI